MTVGTRGFADQRGDYLALDDDVGTLTWGEVDVRTNRLMHGLRDLGLVQGDVLGLLGGNRREWTETLGAANGDGKVFIPINWHFSADEIAYVLSNSGARVIVADAEYGDKAQEAAERAGVDIRIAYGGPIDGFASYDELIAAASPDEPDDQRVGRAMFYTSGTTGRPKGVVSNESTLGADPAEAQAGFAAFMNLLGVPTEDGVAYCGAPLYHGGPLVFALVPYLLGSSLILRRKWDAEEMLRLIDEHSVTTAYAVPTHFTRLLKLPQETRDTFDGSSLRCVYHTAAPCPPEVKRRMIDWWGPVVNELYGATEGGVSVGFTCTSEEWLAKPGTVGKALPTTELHVLDDDGNTLGADEVGQIYLRSLLGSDFEYLGDKDKTDSVHRSPGLFTYGDIGYVDEDGFLFLSDRKIDMIISGGVNIYPAEIESVLMQHPSVADVGVFGIPDEEFGEQVKAAVELIEGADESAVEIELRNLCREQLAGYMVPRSFDFGDLPRTPTGKLPKRELRATYWEGTGRAI